MARYFDIFDDFDMTDKSNHSPDDHNAQRTHGADLSTPKEPVSVQAPKSPKPPKKRSWLAYLFYLVLTLLVVLALLLVLLFYAMGTQGGTKFLLEKIALETGTQLKYSEGNLRDGVWVSDVKIAQGENIEIQVNKAYVQLGWRAVLARQVHLVNSQIDTLNIINKKPPSGEPFDYATIDLPVTLKLDNTSAKQIIYSQVTKSPIYLHDIHVQDGTWAGTKIKLNDAKIRYDDDVVVSRIHGEIDLTGDYPLNATADVEVTAIKKAYFGVLHAKASGTLKRTFGTLASKYNERDIQGEFIAQGLDENSPFSARLNFDEVVLPYAAEQNITLKDGTITADGVVSNIELRINTDLIAKDIPSGRYRGRGVVRDGGMDIPYLRADTPSGALTAKGRMEWSDEFELHATLSGNGYKVREVLPIEYQDYQAYLPKTLTGDLGVTYYYLDDNNHTRFEFDLNQKDGEEIRASLSQSQDNPNSPWLIHADWRNIIRANVPNIDNIHSTHGTADIRLEEGRTYIDARGHIKQLSVAPQGDYVVQANIEKGERIHLTDFKYDGVLGDLSGVGRIDLATAQKPLAWQFDLTTNKFTPNAYFDTPNKTPFQAISGHVTAMGRMRSDRTNRKLNIHDIDLKHTDLTATLADNETVSIKGLANAQVRLMGSDVKYFDAKFDGDVNQSMLPQVGLAKVGIEASGDLNLMTISRLDVDTTSGKASATGKIDLTQGIGWDVRARLDEIDTKNFVGDNANLIAVITGDLVTKGRYDNQKLSDMTAQFDGEVIHDKLPKGALSFDVAGQDARYDVRSFDYKGDAGGLHANGFIDISQGYTWDASATMNRFNVGAFVQDVPSDLTGGFRVRGDWRKQSQAVNIDQLDLKGTLRGQPFSAEGSLIADLALPSDLKAYMNQITAQAPTNVDELLALRGKIDNSARQTQGIIKKLNADNLNIRLGDNALAINGDKSELTTSVSITDLSQILPNAQGAIKGGVILMDDGNSLPTLYVDVAAGGVRTADFVAQEARALGKIVNLGNSDSQLLVDVKDIIALGRVIRSARLDFRGTEQSHIMTINTQSPDNEVNARVEGGLDRTNRRYRGILSDGALRSKFGLLTQRQPTEFSYGISDNSIALAAHCWTATGTDNVEQGSLCLQDTLRYSANGGNVNLVVQNLDTSVFSAVLPDDIHWQSTLNGRVQANWQQGTNPTVNAVLYSDNGRVGLDQDGAYVEMPYERVSVIAQSVTEGLKLRADIAGSAARGYADVVIDPFQGNQKPISGALLINDINLAVLRPFFPNFQTLTGTANIAGGLGGTLSQPLFYGNADLSNGVLAVAGVPINLSNINANAQIRGTNAVLTGDFTAGQGDGELSGEFDWSQTLQARLRISGEDLDVSQPPLVTAKMTPDIEVIVRPFEKYIDIQGVISVPSAIIRPPEATADIVSESVDVTVLDRRAAGNIEQVLAVTAPWSINADIGLDLGDDVTFRGLGARLPLAGALHITQADQGVMRGLGVVQVSERTTIDGIGQNLELNYAQIRFNGDIANPRLSIEAEKEIEGQTVGVRIKGTANNPDITVFNDAGLTEQQAMNAIVTGRITESADSQISEQGFRSQVTNNLAAAGLNLGLSGTRNLTNQIGQAFGLEGLTIDASGNSDDTSVSVTGYISPDLYIRYGVGLFNAESELSMRYQLTRRIYIEAASAAENTVDMIYRWKF